MPSPETPTRRHLERERLDELLADFQDGLARELGYERATSADSVVLELGGRLSEDSADRFGDWQERPGSPD